MPSTTMISCAQCHDCQKDALVAEDSSAVNNQNRMVSYNATSDISEGTSQKSSSEKLNENDAERPDNFKAN